MLGIGTIDMLKLLSDSIVKYSAQINDAFYSLHQRPEVSGKEYETTKFIIDFLCRHKIEVLDLKLSTGCVAIIKGAKNGSNIALRADIDALPIQEETNLKYKSLNQSVMHACGHDAAVSCLLGAAVGLKDCEENLCGNVILIFQPSEETCEGANIIIQTGIFDLYSIKAIFALHVNPEITTGKVGLKYGPLLASTGIFDVTVKGKGTHGAYPHLGADPIVASAAIILAMQSIVSRNVDPQKAAVVTVGSIISGNVHNIIPETAQLRGTIRAFEPNLTNNLFVRLESLVSSIADGFDCEVKFTGKRLTPPLINNICLKEIVEKSSIETFGENNVKKDIDLSMGGDDFAFYADCCPIFYYFLGVKSIPQDESTPLHNPQFVVDVDAIKKGSKLLAISAINALTIKFEESEGESDDVI